MAAGGNNKKEDDVEMKPADPVDEKEQNQQQKKDDDESKEDKNKPVVQRTLTEELQHHLTLLTSAVNLIEPRFTSRVLRTLPTTRRRLQKEPSALKNVIESAYPKSSAQKEALLLALPTTPLSKVINTINQEGRNEMEVDDSAAADDSTNTPAPQTTSSTKPIQPPSEILPEQDIYLTLLSVIVLLDRKEIEHGTQLADHTVARLLQFNRRSLDQLAAKCFFYYSRFHELLGDPNGLASIRPTLLSAYRTANLRHDAESEATILNLLIRGYLHYSLYDQADKLVDKSTFPDLIGNQQAARYSYYIGRIRAIQLNYSEAHERLQLALRRAPDPKGAPGFYQTVNKLFVIVELLMGDIPDRGIFRQPVLRKALAPYLEIAQAVRIGDLSQFEDALNRHDALFAADATKTLIVRLRHNVIKTALRTISLAYSSIPLAEIKTKLGLDSEEETEYIVAKAIRDGVIEATIDHGKKFMKSRVREDVYETAEPSRAFNERITFCLNLHNQSVKALRFPLDMHKRELASAEEAREREKELAKEINDMDSDDDGFGGEPPY